VLPSCTENQPTSTCTCDGSNRESKDGKCVTKSTNTCTAQDQSCTTSGGLAGRCLTDKGPCFYDPVASCRVAFPDCASGSLSKDPNGVCSCTEFALGNNCSPKCTGDKVCTSVGSTAIPSYACVKKTDCTAGQDASLCNCDLTLNVVTNGKCVAKTDNFTVYCKFGDNVSEKKCICTGSDRLVKNGVCVVSNINQICNTGERIAFRNCICDAGRDGSSGNCKDLPAPGYDQVNGVICLRPGVSTKNDGVGCCPGSQFNSDNKCTLYANLPTCPDSSVIVPNAIGNITSPCTCQSGTTYDASQNKCIRLTGGANGVCRDGDVWKRIDKDKNEIVTCQCSTPLRATPDGKCIKPTLTAGQSCAGKANQCVDGTQCYDLSVSGTNFFNIQPTCFGTIDFCTPIVINSITGEKLCFRLSDHPIADGIKQIGAISNVVNIIGSSLTGGVNALINISGNISAPNIEEVIKKCTAEAANEILKSGKKWEYLSSIAQQCIGTKGKEWFDKNIANSNLVTSVISACAGSQNALKPGAVWSELPLLVQTCIAGLVGNAEQWVTDNFTAPVRDNNGVVIVPGKAPKCDKEGNNGRVKTCICNADRAQSYCNFDPTKNPNCKPVDVIVDKKIVNKVYSCDYSKVTAIQTKKPLFTFATKTPSKNKIVLTATQAAIDSCTTLIQNNYLPSSVLPKDTGYLYPYGMQSFKIPCASDTVLQIATELKPGDAAKNWYVRKLGRIQPQNPDLIAYFTFDAARIFQYTENGKTYLVANIPLQNDIFGDDGYGDNQISGVFGFATDDTALTGSLNKTTLQYVNELRAQQAIDQGVINNANSSSGTNTSLQPNNPSSSKSVLTIIKTGGLATSIFFIIGSFALTGLVWYTLTLRKRQLENIRNI